MILFSIPVHEKPEVVENQIQNFLKYNPGASILLHISKQMPPEEVAQVRQLTRIYPQLYINPEQLYTGWGDGSQFKIHLSNFHYALKKNIPFSHICLHASNDMFIKHGLHEKIKDYDAGYDLLTPPEYSTVLQQEKNIKQNFFYSCLMKKYNISSVKSSAVEGTFYSKQLIEIICQRLNYSNTQELPYIFSIGYNSKSSWRYTVFIIVEKITRRLGITNIFPSCKEEVVFPTFSSTSVSELNTNMYPMNYCYINWSNNLKISKSEITAIINNDWLTLKTQNLAINAIDHKLLGTFQFFTVKRVDRNLNDPIREFINNLNCNNR